MLKVGLYLTLLNSFAMLLYFKVYVLRYVI